MSKVTSGIERVRPITPLAAVRRKRTYADKVDWAPLLLPANASGRRPELHRPSRTALARIVFRARRQKR